MSWKTLKVFKDIAQAPQGLAPVNKDLMTGVLYSQNKPRIERDGNENTRGRMGAGIIVTLLQDSRGDTSEATRRIIIVGWNPSSSGAFGVYGGPTSQSFWVSTKANTGCHSQRRTTTYWWCVYREECVGDIYR